MPSISFICALLGSISVAVASPSTWLNNIEEALQKANKEQKAVYLAFSGSDWCPPCQELESNVWESRSFKKLADKNLVLVNLDYPKDKKLDSAQAAYNEKTRKKYGISAHPTAFLMDSQGNVFWKRTGTASQSSYMAEINNALKSKDTILKNLHSAREAQGEEKARLLFTAYQEMTPETQGMYEATKEEIKRLDTHDALGLKAREKSDKAEEKQEQLMKKYMDNEVLPLLKKGDHLSSIAKINDYISTANLSPLNLQRAYQVMARINVDMGEITQAINLLEEVIKIAPQSPDAEKARASIKALKQ